MSRPSRPDREECPALLQDAARLERRYTYLEPGDWTMQIDLKPSDEPVGEPIASPDARRAALHAELEATRAAYQALLARVGEGDWERPSGNPAWNNRQMLYHMIMALDLLPQDIRFIRRGGVPAPPAWLFNWLNIYYTRWRARGKDRAALAAAYDAAHARVLTLLDGIQPEEWQLAGDYPDLGGNMPGGERTIEMLFHYVSQHFYEHEAEVLLAERAVDQAQPEKAAPASSQVTGVQMNEPYQQADHGILVYPTSGWHQALFKWPVQLWRLGLAPLIGRYMMLISHTGRKSGLTRRTMTEMYELHGRKYAPSGFGDRAQWYQNIMADPRVTIQTAAGAESARAVRVTDGEELLALMDRVGLRSRLMRDQYLTTIEVEPTREDILAKKDRFYWLRFDPTTEATPPPLPADRVWLWPILLGLVLLAWLLARPRSK